VSARKEGGSDAAPAKNVIVTWVVYGKASPGKARDGPWFAEGSLRVGKALEQD